MLTIHADCPLTRRKTVNHVLDADDKLLYSSRNFMACLWWVFDQGHPDALIIGEAEGDEITMRLKIELVPSSDLPDQAPTTL